MDVIRHGNDAQWNKTLDMQTSNDEYGPSQYIYNEMVALKRNPLDNFTKLLFVC